MLMLLRRVEGHKLPKKQRQYFIIFGSLPNKTFFRPEAKLAFIIYGICVRVTLGTVE